MRRDLAYLDDILAAADEIVGMTADVTQEDLPVTAYAKRRSCIFSR